MQDVEKHLVGMLAVDLVRAFNAQVQGRWGIAGKRNGNAVVVAHFGSFGVSSVRAHVPLANKR